MLASLKKKINDLWQWLYISFSLSKQADLLQPLCSSFPPSTVTPKCALSAFTSCLWLSSRKAPPCISLLLKARRFTMSADAPRQLWSNVLQSKGNEAILSWLKSHSPIRANCRSGSYLSLCSVPGIEFDGTGGSKWPGTRTKFISQSCCIERDWLAMKKKKTLLKIWLPSEFIFEIIY